jgi:hypothetical protein
MSELKVEERDFKPFDWYGWVMSLVGITLMYYWSTALNISWSYKILMFTTVTFMALDYFFRVAYGRVCRRVYYDTIIHNMYEIKARATGDTYFVCAESEADLVEYMKLHYESVKYDIVEEHNIESFVKTEVEL